MKELADLLRDYGSIGVAALALGYGVLERKERQEIQRKFEGYAETLPKELLALLRETHEKLTTFTQAANAILARKE